jgi:predicted phosphodiesterase
LKAIFVGDTHNPYANHDHINQILDRVDHYQPDYVVQMGDAYDLYNFGRWPRNVSFMTPQEELIEARAGAEAFRAAMRAAAPKARLHQILGNHDDRILKLVRGKVPELEAVLEVLDYKSLWRFPGVETQPDSATELVIPGLDKGRPVVVLHGHYSKLGDHMRYNQISTVTGHSHKGGAVFDRVRGETLWELNAGYSADQKSAALAYGAQKYSRSVPGFGLVDEDGPRFIPL